MIIKYSDEIDEKKAKFLAMSREQFDAYMRKKYPVMFKERNLSITQSCMFWGLDIGRGWYWILDDLCEKLTFISNRSGLNVVFSQIKEKYGGARFYHSTRIKRSVLGTIKRFLFPKACSKSYNVWTDFIDDTVSNSEKLCDYYCAECGERKDDMITIGYWVYDRCEKCLEKDREEGLKIWREKKAIEEGVKNILYSGSKEEFDIAKKLVEDFNNRIEIEREKNNNK